MSDAPEPFRYGGEVPPGEKRQFRYEVGETYLGDPVEMGRAHPFQPALIDRAIDGIESVLAEYGLLPDAPVAWPGWHRVVDADREKTWLRADTGGLVEMKWRPHPLVRDGETICTSTDHFKRDEQVVTAPFTGLVVGILENPVALPGHPLCHLVRIDEETRTEIDARIARGEFDGAQLLGARWLGDGGDLD